jgi:peptidyl-dipeptidase A
MSTSLQNFLNSQVAALQPLLTQINQLYWLIATTGAAEHEQQFAKAMRELRERMADPARYKKLNDLLSESDTPPFDALTARQAKLLDNQLRGSQITPDLIARMTDLEVQAQSAFTKFRALINGQPVTDNDLKQVLHESSDVALRRQAWEASKQIGTQVADTVRELVRVRNEAARQVGFDNFYSMRLELDELNEKELFDLFDQLKTGSDPAWKAYKGKLDAQLAERFHTTPDKLRPWHYGDPFFQEGQPSDVNLDPYFADKDLEALTRTYYAAIGLDINDVLARSDLYEREGKEQHAFCTHIDREGDVRVLCNVRPDAKWAGTMLHEFGHAVYDKYIDRSLPFLLREPAHTLTTEAIAIMGENHINESAWLARYAGVPASDAQAMSARLREAYRTHALIFARWVFVMTHFERELYRNPEADLNTMWWDIVERFQEIRRPDERNAPDWAAKIHIGTAPVYYHNYLLGAMIAAQLRGHILTNVVNGSDDAYVTDRRVGQYLVEKVFKPGSTRDWRGWLRHATEQDLSAEFYVDQLAGTSHG